MARGRMISKSLSTSEKYAHLVETAGELAEFCHALYPLLLVHTDDFGRLQGDAWTVKSMCYPASHRTLADFEAALGHLTCIGLIAWYEVQSKKFIQVGNFEIHQLGLHKRTRSHFPELPGTSGNFREFPHQEKEGKEGKEGKGTKEKIGAHAARPSGRASVGAPSGDRPHAKRTQKQPRRLATDGRAKRAASATVNHALLKKYGFE